MGSILMVAFSAYFRNNQCQNLYILLFYCCFACVDESHGVQLSKIDFFPNNFLKIWQSLCPRRKELGHCSHLSLASWLLCFCRHWDIEETLQEIQLQDPRKNNDKALGCWPPIHIVIVWLEKEKVSCFSHASKVVVSPHVKDIVMHLSCALLRDRKWNTGKVPLCLSSSLTWVPTSTNLL